MTDFNVGDRVKLVFKGRMWFGTVTAGPATGLFPNEAATEYVEVSWDESGCASDEDIDKLTKVSEGTRGQHEHQKR